MKLLQTRKELMFVVFVLLFSAFTMASCGNGDDDTDGDMDTDMEVDGDMETDMETDGDDETTGDANVRAIHLSPDAPTVDVLVNGALRAIEDLDFPDSTAYLPVPPGNYDFDIVPADGELADSVLNIPSIDLEADTSYTAVAHGTLANIAALLLVDDLSSPGDGKIRVRAIHVADGVGEVDIWNIPAEGDPAILYEDVDYGDAGAYMVLPAASYKLGIDVDDDATPDLTFTTGELAAGTILNVFAVKDGDDVFLIAQTQDGTTIKIDPDAPAADMTDVRFIHLAPDVAGVDVWVDETIKAFEDLAYKKGTAYANIEAGTHDVNIIATGDADLTNSILDISVDLMKDKKYTAAAYQNPGASAILLEDDLSAPADGNLRVRAIHTANGVGEVDIWNIPQTGDPTALFEDLAAGTASNAIEIPAGAYKLGIDVDNDATPDLTFTTGDLPAGAILNVFAVKDGDDVFLLAQTQQGITLQIDADPDMTDVRFIHLAPDVAGVDIWVDEAVKAFENLAFKSGTIYANIEAGTHDVNIIATGDADLTNSVLDISVDLMKDKMYTAAAYQNPGALALLIEDDLSAPAAGNIRVRAVHTANGVGEVDIWNIPDTGDPTALFENLAAGTASAAAEVPAGVYTLGIDVDDDATPDLVYTLPNLAEGTIANVFALKTGADVTLVAQFADGTTAEISATPPAK